MAYSPEITQRINKAVLEASDQRLALDILLEYNRAQDVKAGAIEDALLELQISTRNLRSVVYSCMVPIAGASLGVLAKLAHSLGIF